MKKSTLRFIATVLIYTGLYTALNFGFYGIPHFGLPDAEEIVQVRLEDTRYAESPRTLTKPEDIVLARNLANTLRYTLGKAEGSEPVVTITYELASGETVEIAADETTVWYRGKAHKIKEGRMFLNLEHGCFFSNSDPLPEDGPAA